MFKFSKILSLVAAASLLLAACGAKATATSAPTQPPATTAPPPTTTTNPPTTTAFSVTTPVKRVIFADDFDSEANGSTPSKWIVNEPANTDVSIDDTVFFGAKGKSAKMQDNSSTEAPTMNKIIGVQTGTFWYQVSMRLGQTNQIVGAAYLSNSTVPGGRFGIDNLGVSVTFWSDGNLKYNDNDNDLASWKNVQTYQADTWYTIKVFVDVANQKINLYVDDVLKLTDIKFRYPVTALDQISFGGRVELPASNVWIDSLLVTEGS